jgi:hypothetical protein
VGVAHLYEVRADLGAATGRILVARHDHLRLERDDALEGGDVLDRLADLLSAHGEHVGELREVGTEEVAREQDLLPR